MKKYLFPLLAVLALASCGAPSSETEEASSVEEVAVVDAEHTPENSLDWFATYSGTIPCASCEGIKTELVLNEDQTYQLTEEYLGEDNSKETVTGSFTWTDNGSVVKLDDNAKNRAYRIAESFVFHLDDEGKVIEGDLSEQYKLDKIQQD